LKQNKIILTILVKHKRRILLRGKKEKESLETQLELKLSGNIWSFVPDLSYWWSGYISQQVEDFWEPKDESKKFGCR
jgi:hypothetical protein